MTFHFPDAMQHNFVLHLNLIIIIIIIITMIIIIIIIIIVIMDEKQH